MPAQLVYSRRSRHGCYTNERRMPRPSPELSYADSVSHMSIAGHRRRNSRATGPGPRRSRRICVFGLHR